MRVIRTATAVATAATLLAPAPLALAASSPSGSTPHNGQIQVFVRFQGESKASITITGVIGDYGTLTTTDQNGKPDQNGSYQHAKLRHGTFVINSTRFDKGLAHLVPKVNAANCSVVGTASGPTTVSSGTGDYAGISGTVTVHLTFAGIAPKKANGKCNLADSAPTYGEYSGIIGSGRVTFAR